MRLGLENYAEWSKVPCAEDYKMRVSAMGFHVFGAAEIQEVTFRWFTDIHAKQDLLDIVEFESFITCYLKISDKDGTVLAIVEVFKIDHAGRVKQIWA